MSPKITSLPLVCLLALSTILCEVSFHVSDTSNSVVLKEKNFFTESPPLKFVLLVNGLCIVTVFKPCSIHPHSSMLSLQIGLIFSVFLTFLSTIPTSIFQVQFPVCACELTPPSEYFNGFLIDLPASCSPKPFS
jgi:hypothetical protein